MKKTRQRKWTLGALITSLTRDRCETGRIISGEDVCLKRRQGSRDSRRWICTFLNNAALSRPWTQNHLFSLWPALVQPITQQQKEKGKEEGRKSKRAQTRGSHFWSARLPWQTTFEQTKASTAVSKSRAQGRGRPRTMWPTMTHRPRERGHISTITLC